MSSDNSYLYIQPICTKKVTFIAVRDTDEVFEEVCRRILTKMMNIFKIRSTLKSVCLRQWLVL